MEKEIATANKTIRSAVSNFQFRFAENFEKLMNTTEKIELVSYSKWQKERLAKNS